VEPQSETVWHQADWYHVPKLAFVNKMDRLGADFHNVVSQIEEKFKTQTLVLQLPIGEESGFRGVLDLLHMRQIIWLDESLGAQFEYRELDPELRSAAEDAREALVAKVAENDDELMERYLEGQPISGQDLVPVIRKMTLSLKAVPVFCGSALKNKGIQPLLDAIVAYLPSPEDVPAVEGINPKTNEKERRSNSEKEPFAALAFKIQMDQGRKLTYARVYSGKIQAGADVVNVSKESKEKVSRIFQMHANKRERLEEIGAGNIVAIMGIKSASTGDSLCAPGHPILLEPLNVYEPVISIAVEANTRGDQEKLLDSLQKLSEEDPTFRFSENPDSGQTIISGMGELHLEIVMDRLARDFNVGVNAGKPQVVYRETVLQSALAQGTFDREIGGSRHFGVVELHVQPLERGAGNRILNKVRDGSIPESILPALEQGIRDASGGGPILGYPMVDVEATICGGTYQEGLSSEIAMRVAATMAFKRACEQASPALLEPYMAVEVLVPEDFLGEVLGDINSRKGRVENISARKAIQVVQAVVPLSKMFGYSTALRSATQGRATFSMHFSHYDMASQG
jgi:elongation factor G